MERLFVLKTLSRTQRATKVKKFVGFSLKPLRCRDPALPPLYGHAYSRPFFHAYFSCIYAHDTPPRVQHFSAFHCLLESRDTPTAGNNLLAISQAETVYKASKVTKYMYENVHNLHMNIAKGRI